MQLDGDLTREEFEKALNMGVDGALKVNEIQKQTLLNEYKE
jgi:exosome complex component RRP41